MAKTPHAKPGVKHALGLPWVPILDENGASIRWKGAGLPFAAPRSFSTLCFIASLGAANNHCSSRGNA